MTCSVVLPYYENQCTLATCLRSFSAQTLPPAEIIVVDDGSAHPAAPIAAALEPSCVPVRCLTTPHAGQSAATNAGIRQARGDWLLLTCADIEAHADLLAQHGLAQEQARSPTVVLGSIPYAQQISMTPFMAYLDQPGPQFCFAWISDVENVSPKYCYSPNLSVPKDLLLQVGMFDEAFRYGYQDTDLGMRLHQAGARIVYRQQAIAYHHHPTDVRRFAQRQMLLGDATLHMIEKYPEPDNITRLRGMVQRHQRYIARLPAILSDIEAREKQLGEATRLPDSLRQQLHRLYDFVLTLALVDGILQQPERAKRLLLLSEATSRPLRH